eukprot:jgi/Picsp_1/6047/NSC_03401-R1_hypothetical protein CHLNCDRAFT_133119 [Chlorella variabilis]
MADEDHLIEDGAGLLPSLLGQYGSDESDVEPEENGALGHAAGRLEQSDDVEKGSAHEDSDEEQGENGQREIDKTDDGIAVVNGSKPEVLGSVQTEHNEMAKKLQAPQIERQKRNAGGRGEERVVTEKYIDDGMVEFLSTLPNEFQCGGPISTEVDSKTARMVQQWKRLKDQGYTITDDLRKRNWYKSPDCMRLMVEKFEIDSGGSNLKRCPESKEQASSRGNVKISELRKAWDVHEAKRKVERKTGDARIDFVKGKDAGKYDDSAVSQAVLAAQKRAASFSADRGKRDKVRKR